MLKTIQFGFWALVLVALYGNIKEKFPQVEPAVDASLHQGTKAYTRVKTYDWTDVGIMIGGVIAAWQVSRRPRELWAKWKAPKDPMVVDCERPAEVTEHRIAMNSAVLKVLNRVHQNFMKNETTTHVTGPMTRLALIAGARQRWGNSIIVRVRKIHGSCQYSMKFTECPKYIKRLAKQNRSKV